MRICYLHIGPHKTASSTIQLLLHDNAGLLFKDGLYVPMMPKSKRSHHRLADEFHRPAQTTYRDAIRQELEAAGKPETIVISSEVFSTMIHLPAYRHRLASFFTQLGYRVKILVYIRPQICSVNSHFTQQLKYIHLCNEFDDFFQTFIDDPAMDHLSRFRPLIEDGRFETEFIPFATPLLHGGICPDFLARLGIVAHQAGRYTLAVRKNISPGPKTVAALLQIGRAIGRNNEEDIRRQHQRAIVSLGNLTELLGWDRTRFNGLGAAQQSQLMAKFQEPNEAFARLAWNAPWAAHFATDEAEALASPPCRFFPAKASKRERAEFDEICAYALQLIDDGNVAQTPLAASNRERA